ncbi:MAG TPA: M43 family zinc metalloprotease [Bacteroidales bacterium]|nr:M43 family zinc metalloprotease [Bacteroidales bacterium]HSA42877.1 M43 family zinc metalloprotease [Bacteroidales bacterium]
MILSRELLFLVLFGLSVQLLSAQETDPPGQCGTVAYNQWLEKQDPGYASSRKSVQEKIRDYLRRMNVQKEDSNQVIQIPVIVHILWNTAEQNIPDEQVWSQIFALNEDFRRLNADTVNTPVMFKPVAADSRIEFCLARRLPDNSGPSNGILRIWTDKAEFGLDNKVKSAYHGGSAAWDRDRYLNIWVCKLTANYLGYSQYPGGPDSTDGVVIDYRCFGRVGTLNPHYNKGRTATHEIGHWLDLYHIWGDDFGSCDGSDYVDDTPNAADANYYCPTHPRITNCNATGEMFMNYMDYCDDHCFNIYTAGQAQRMRAAIFTVRTSLLSSDGCDDYIGMQELEKDNHVTLYPNPASDYIHLTFSKPLNKAVFIVSDMTGRTCLLGQATNVTHQALDVSHLNDGLYFLSVRSGSSSVTLKLLLQR